MTKLRVLRVLSPFCYYIDPDPTVHFPSGLQLFSDRLSYLEWSGYPSKSLPLTFCPWTLVELSMPDSHVVKLWDGVQDLKNLKRIDLSGSRSLTELPDFSMASNLKTVYLSWCTSLRHVHSSLLSCPSLERLDLIMCENLNWLVSEAHSKSLKYLNLYGCNSLEKFGVYSEEMTDLKLTKTRIDVLPSCIGRLSKLEHLDLSGSDIECLPASIKQLNALKDLSLSDCTRLRSLPELPQSIETLDARNCIALKAVVIPKISMERNSIGCNFDFSKCRELNEDTMSSIFENTYSWLKGYPGHFKIFARYPGTRVPEWFPSQNKRAKEDSIKIFLDPTSRILGFVFCVVSCPQPQSQYCSDFDDDVWSTPDFECPVHPTVEFDGTCAKFRWNVSFIGGWISHLVRLRFYDCLHFTSDLDIWSRVKSLEFVVYAHDEWCDDDEWSEECKIEEYGLLPLYAVEKKRAADTCHRGKETKMIKK